jgi:V-ATPase subunit C
VCHTAQRGIENLFVGHPSSRTPPGQSTLPSCVSIDSCCDLLLVFPPACSRLLEDKEGYVLYTVLILKKFKESFVNDARNKKFPVREFVYHPEAAGSGIAKLHKMEHEVQEALVRTTPRYLLPLLNQFTCTELLCLQSHLQEQCARKFGDSMSIWMHLKVQQLVCFSFFVIESPCHALRCPRARPFVCLWKQYCATVYPSILCVR